MAIFDKKSGNVRPFAFLCTLEKDSVKHLSKME